MRASPMLKAHPRGEARPVALEAAADLARGGPRRGFCFSLHEGEGSLINTIHWVRFPRNGFCPHAPVAQLESVQKQKPPIPHPPADGSV